MSSVIIDQSTFERFRNGDQRAFKKIFDLYSPMLYGYVYKNWTKDKQTSGTIIADAFLALWNNRENIDAPNRVFSYSFTVAKNKYFDFYKKMAKDRLIVNVLAVDIIGEVMSDKKTSMQFETEPILSITKINHEVDELLPPYRAIFKSYISRIDEGEEDVATLFGLDPGTVDRNKLLRLVQAFERLTPKGCRDVLLGYLGNKKTADIAKKLKITEDTVRVQKDRGLKKIINLFRVLLSGSQHQNQDSLFLDSTSLQAKRKILSKAILQRRHELQITVEKAAEMMGIDYNNYYSVEACKHFPVARSFPRIINFLGYYPFPEDLKTLGGRILQYRYCNGLNAAKLCEMLGVYDYQLNKFENCVSEPSPEILERMRKIGVSVEYSPDSAQTRTG